MAKAYDNSTTALGRSELLTGGVENRPKKTDWPTFGDTTGSAIYVRSGTDMCDVYRSNGRKTRSPIGRLYHRTGRRTTIPKTAIAVEGTPEGPSAIRCTGWEMRTRQACKIELFYLLFPISKSN